MIEIDGERLSCAQIAAIADGEAVQVSEPARARANASHLFAIEMAATREIYGRSTGVGANRDVVVTDLSAHGERLLRSHATSGGPVRSDRRIRATMAVRLNQLAVGGSGVAPTVLAALATALNDGNLPPVREYGGIGTADLAALATIGLTLQTSGGVALGLDAIGFISSNAAALADAALTVVEFDALLSAGLVVAALTFVAVRGNAESFAPTVEIVTPFPGVRRTTRLLRALLDGAGEPARIQDPFGLRVLPQVHGLALDSVVALAEVVERMAAAPSENPVLLPDRGQVAHHGGFYAGYLTAATDAAALALAQSAQLALGRLSMLVEPAITGQSAFLSDGTPGASGVMLLEYVAAAALGAFHRTAAPAALQSVSISRGAEGQAPFASMAAADLLSASAPYRTVLACEAVAAVRAVRAGPEVIPPALLPALEHWAGLNHSTQQHNSTQQNDRMADRDLTGDIAAAEAALSALAALLPPVGN
jgi:histidine ammonia-lyase